METVSITISTHPVTTFGGLDGSITTFAVGGLEPYKYIWKKLNPDGTKSVISTAKNLLNVGIGRYYLEVQTSDFDPTNVELGSNAFADISVLEQQPPQSSGMFYNPTTKELYDFTTNGTTIPIVSGGSLIAIPVEYRNAAKLLLDGDLVKTVNPSFEQWLLSQ